MTFQYIAVKKFLAVALVGAAISAAKPAQAGLIDITYTFSDSNTVALIVGGQLRSDGNTFDISSVQSLSLNGNVVADPFTVVSTDRAYIGTNTNPTATLNGSYLDLFVTDTMNGNIFGFAVGDLVSQYGGNFVGASVGLGGSGAAEAFQLASFTTQALPNQGSLPVPEPASLTLFASMLAIGGLIVVGRGRATRKVMG